MSIIVFWLIFSLGVALLADKRGRSGAGYFFLALLLSPLIGFIILLCSKDLRADEQQTRRDHMMMQQVHAQRQQLEELKRLRAGEHTSDDVLPPPGGFRKFRVAKGGEELGAFSVRDIRAMLSREEVTWEDYYWDSAANAWLELICIETEIHGDSH